MPTKSKKQLSDNAFAGQATQPTDHELALALGVSDALWHDLIADLKRDLKLDAQEWKSYSVKAGWSIRLQLKKRNIVYLSPRLGYFVAAFVLGDNAVAAARKIALPASILKMIDEAKRYAEGTAIRIEVRDAKDAGIVRSLARVKLDN